MQNNIGQIKSESKPRGTKRYKKSIIIILIVVLTAIIGTILFMKREEGNGWICEDGQWITKGETKLPKPEAVCKSDVLEAQSGERVKPSEEIMKANSEKIAEGINIRVELPHVNQVIENPIKIKGEAKGWYWEGSFPVKLIDGNGNVLGSGTAIAQSDWQTDEYVPFSAEISFDAKGAKSGDLIFQKSNPSGIPEKSGTFSFPVFFE